MEDLPYCTELPDGLCQIPSLELLKIESAPCIKSVGPEFLLPHHVDPQPAKILVVKCPGLMWIRNLPKLQNLVIIHCPELKVLEGLPTLQRLTLEDYDMETLPVYLRDVNPRLLDLDCDVSLLASIAKGESGPEWDKCSHIKQVKAYADDDDNNIDRKWYVKYTRDPFSFKTNISSSVDAPGKLIELQLLLHTDCLSCCWNISSLDCMCAVAEDEMEEVVLDEVEEISRDEIEEEPVIV
jgi:hypothetical protein